MQLCEHGRSRELSRHVTYIHVLFLWVETPCSLVVGCEKYPSPSYVVSALYSVQSDIAFSVAVTTGTRTV